MNTQTHSLILTDAFALGGKLTPAQRAFRKLLTRIDKLKAQWTDLNTLVDAHRTVYHQKITPLKNEINQIAGQLAQLLDQRLQAKMVQGKPLTKIERATATEILCCLSEVLAAQGDKEMAALHDVYSPHTLKEKEHQAAETMRSVLEGMLGGPLHAEGDAPPESLEELMNAGHLRMQQAMDEQEAQEKQAQATRKLTARQKKAKEEQEDADATLRKVFRQLASALHPDREPNPAEQARKTELMSQANAAYQKRDLVALLQIQLRTELTDAASVAQMAEEKITSLSVLLKEQITELQDELTMREHAVLDEFRLDFVGKISATRLRHALTDEMTSMQEMLHGLKTDFQCAQDDVRFKPWLKKQRHLI